MTMTPEDVEKFIKVRQELRDEIREARETLRDLREEIKRGRTAVAELLESELTEMVNKEMRDLDAHITSTIRETDQRTKEHLMKNLGQMVTAMHKDPVIQLSVAALSVTLNNPVVHGVAKAYVRALADKFGIDEAAEELFAVTPHTKSIRVVTTRARETDMIPSTFLNSPAGPLPTTKEVERP